MKAPGALPAARERKRTPVRTEDAPRDAVTRRALKLLQGGRS